MLLLTMESRWGHRPFLGVEHHTIQHQTNDDIRMVAFATRMPLGLALDEIKRYEELFLRKHKTTFTEFRLISVSTIMNVETKQLEAVDVLMVERLCKSLLED